MSYFKLRACFWYNMVFNVLYIRKISICFILGTYLEYLIICYFLGTTLMYYIHIFSFKTIIVLWSRFLHFHRWENRLIYNMVEMRYETKGVTLEPMSLTIKNIYRQKNFFVIITVRRHPHRWNNHYHCCQITFTPLSNHSASEITNSTSQEVWLFT